MVNKELFTVRLLEMMKYYELSASGLADSINVQRSSISHLLSGRNKPSLDFVVKILNKYNEVSFDWLVNGKGSINLQTQKHVTPTLFDQGIAEKEEIVDKKYEKNTSQDVAKGKKHIKTLLLYDDGSFDVFDKTN